MSVRRFAFLCLGLALAFSSAERAQAQFNSLYVFGDSLSDTGNAFALTGGASPPSPPYFNGRTSNGPLWVESFAPALGFAYTQATNFAVAGAESGTASPTDGLNQVNGFIGGGGSVPADALTVVWIGNNDFLNNAATTPPSVLTAQVAGNVGTMIGTLNAFGAQNFLVPNLPKFGNTPGGASTGLADSLNQLASFYNTNLHTALIGLESQLGVRIFILDTEGLFDDLVGSPEVYGIANTSIPCLTPAGPTGACPTAEAANAALFYDPIHPTAAVHSIFAQFASATLAIFDQPRVVVSSSFLGNIITEGQRQTIEQRLMTLRALNDSNEGPANMWASFRYANGGMNDRPALIGFDYEVRSVTIGVDKMVGNGWVVGAAATFSETEADLDGGGRTDIDTLMGSAYASYKSENGLVIDLSAAYGGNDFKTQRNTSFAFRPTAVGDTNGTGVYGNVEVGYEVHAGDMAFGPFAGLRYQSVDVSAYAENGAAMLNLDVFDQRASGLIGSIGLELGGALTSDRFKLIPIVRVTYEKELNKFDYGARIQTSTGQIATIGHGNPADDRFVANAGLAIVGKRLSISASYQGTLDYSDGNEDAFVGRLTYSF